MNDVLQLPFDQYQRYRLVADLLGSLRREGQPHRVLDVGGATGLLRRFDPEDEITLVDRFPADIRDGLVQGDGSALPFRENAFEVVCAFDTLEHIPPDRREAFVAECSRVASRYVILAGPYEAPAVRRAEELLQRFLREKLEFVHHYLEEHRDYGLPDRGAVEAQFASLGAQVGRVGQANLERWLPMMVLAMVLDEDPALRALAGEVFAYYNEHLYASDTQEPVYRHVVVAAFGGAPLPDFEASQPPVQAPREALAPFTLLSAELVAFDRERAVWRGERAGFEASVSELQQELAREKRERAELAEKLESERAEQARVIERLEADLGTFREVLADREARLEEHVDVLADREGQLEEHRQAVRSLEEVVRSLRSELGFAPTAAMRRLGWLVRGKPQA